MQTEIITAQALPDEFICGYRGRLALLNQYANEMQFMADFRRHLYLEAGPENPTAVVLARAAGTGLPQFIANHSFLHLHRAVTPHDPLVIHGDATRLDIIEYFGARLFRQEARFCPACAQQDIADRGFAYWRRSHQLPGVTWCLTHGVELRQGEGGRHGFRKMPGTTSGAVPQFSDHELAETRNAPVILRYLDILNAFMSATAPISLLHASSRIRQLAKERQFRIAIDGKKPTLSDLAQAVLPEAWLLAEYPTIAARNKGEFFGSLDNITMGRTPVSTYALALAVIFESSSEAISYWYDDTSSLPSQRKQYRTFGWDFWNSERIFKLYVAHDGNHGKIADALNIDPTTTRLGLVSAGLPALGQIDLVSIGNAFIAFDAGMSFEQACKSNGVDREDVEKLQRIMCSRMTEAFAEIFSPKSRRRRSRVVNRSNPSPQTEWTTHKNAKRSDDDHQAVIIPLFG